MWLSKNSEESYLLTLPGTMSLITCIGMAGYECFMQIMFPDIPLWQSSVLTIMAAALLTAVSGAVIVKREKIRECHISLQTLLRIIPEPGLL